MCTGLAPCIASDAQGCAIQPARLCLSPEIQQWGSSGSINGHRLIFGKTCGLDDMAPWARFYPQAGG